MNSALAEMPEYGEQQPRHLWLPPHTSSLGEEGLGLCRMAGLYLDPWQAFVLCGALNEKTPGVWAAIFVALMVSRQNGKGSILEARELVGLFLLDEMLIIHTAHQFKTAKEGFLRIRSLIAGTPALHRRVRAYRIANGELGIELKSGARLNFVARGQGSIRGMSPDCVILDEAMFISEETQGDVLPALSAKPNPQVWYTGSAVDQMKHHDGIVFARLREQGIAGGSQDLAYFEWSAADSIVEVTKNPDILTDPRALAQSNPGLGYRLNHRFVQSERGKSTDREYAVERLGIGDWPCTDETGPRVVNPADWEACADPDSSFDGVPVFAVDVNPERTAGTIAVAGTRSDGVPHLEIIEHRSGVGWLVDACAQLQQAYKQSSFIVQARGPAAAIVADLEAERLSVVPVPTGEYASACGAFYDAVKEHRLCYVPPQPDIDGALDGAKTRVSGESWVWSRKDSTGDISPLVAATLALWGVLNVKPKPRAQLHDPDEVARRMVAEGRACGKCWARLTPGQEHDC